MAANISPEEKLLKLIKGQRSASAHKKIIPPIRLTPAVAVNSFATLPTNNPAKIKHPLYRFYNKILSLLDSRKVIWLVFIVSCIYLIYSFVYPEIALKKIKLQLAAEKKIYKQESEQQREVKPYEFYLQGLMKRQIFQGGAVSSTAPASAAESASIKDMNLVGIVSGDTPQAIIEDKKAQKTYYVNKGQLIGGFQLEDIQDGKIILNNNGQRFEMHI